MDALACAELSLFRDRADKLSPVEFDTFQQEFCKQMDRASFLQIVFDGLNARGSANSGNINKTSQIVTNIIDSREPPKSTSPCPTTQDPIKLSSPYLSVCVIGRNHQGEFGIGNKKAQKQLIECYWSKTIKIRNIYAAHGYTLIEDMNGNYYSAGDNDHGACTVNFKSERNFILSMTPITCFKENNLKISQVFVNNRGDAPFWKTHGGSIYTSCNSNYRGRIGVEVYYKTITKIPFLSQFSIKKMVSGDGCSIAICNDGSVYSTGHGDGKGDNGL
eukprot:236370_1